MTWEVRHAEWQRETAAPCSVCEAERDRGIRRAATVTRREAFLLACAFYWHGTLAPLLRRWARRVRGRVGVWVRRITPRAQRVAADTLAARRLTAYRLGLEELRLAAYGQEAALLALFNRGPVQSRPEWLEYVREADTRMTQAFQAWADRLFIGI